MQQLAKITCGESLDFTKQLDKNKFLTSGFSSPEKWGTWTIGDKAILKFIYHPSRCKGISLKLVSTAFINSKNKSITSYVQLNGYLLGKLNFVHKGQGKVRPQKYSFRIPNAYLFPDKINLIKFTIRDAQSPYNLGLSRDKRFLGLGLIRFEFEEASVK
jgi:hypothetical protein